MKYAYTINIDGTVTARRFKASEKPAQVVNKLIALASKQRQEGLATSKELNSK